MTAVEGTVQPPVDDLQARYREQARAAYRFTWADREWLLPHLGELDYRLQGEIETYDALGLAELQSLFARIFGEDQAAAWEQVEVPTGFLFMLFDAWVTFSGRKPGESPASKRSSKSTGTKSRPTSAASTSSVSPKRSTAKRAPRKAASQPGNS